MTTARRSALRLLVPVACAACAVSLPAVVALASTPSGLRSVLARWQFWTFELQFVVLVVAGFHQWPHLARQLAAPARVWAAVAACVGLALVLTAGVAPQTSRIYFDEQIYQSIGQSLSDERLAQMCNDGVVEYGRLQCRNGEYNKQPYGYPYLLSLAYRLMGAGPAVAHHLNNLAFAALVVVVFLLGSLVFRSTSAGLGAALVVSLVPMQILWSNTAAAEPTAALMSAVALLAAVQYVRSRSRGALVWCLAAVVFASSFRPECLLVVPLVAGMVAVFARDELRQPRFWWAAGGAALIGWNVVAHTLAVRHEPWGASGERMSLEFVGMNLRTNGLFYLWDERFPVVFTMLAATGLWVYRRQAITWSVLAAFALFWGVFLGFYAGSYDYGADVRYSLMSYAPLAVLAGAGLAWIVHQVERRVGLRAAPWAVTAALLFHWLLYLPLVRATGEEAWAARADVAFVDRTIAQLPANAVVLTHTPSTFFVRRVNAVQTSIGAMDPNRISELFERHGGGVYLYWGFWCNVADPVQQAFCTAVLDRYPHAVLAEERVRTYRFTLYRLQPGPRTRVPQPPGPPSSDESDRTADGTSGAEG